MPWHEYSDYYLPEYKLHTPVSNMKNENTREQLENRIGVDEEEPAERRPPNLISAEVLDKVK